MSPAEGAQTIARSRQPWVSTVTPDAIRHFAWGIGDNNPLWGTAVAPPCFLYGVDETTVAPGYADCRRIYHAVHWTFFDRIPVGTDITALATLVEEVPHDDGLLQRGRVRFQTEKSALLAIAETECLRTARAVTPAEDRPEIRYTGEQLADIEATVMAEQRRGETSRFWEYLQGNEVLGPLLKGPLSIMDVVAWSAATSGVTNSDDELSEGGLHAETATGPELVSWISQLATDWMGDGGFLYKLSLTLQECPPLGTTTTIEGQVVEVIPVEGQMAAIVALSARNQDGQPLAQGSATIILPSNEKGAVTLPLQIH
jgi:hypothetical protein